MTANLLLADEMHGTRPACWNRPKPAEGHWYGVGREPDGRLRMRWYRNRFVEICGTWLGTGIGPTPETARYPQAHAWDCRGCRLLPKEFTV